MVFVAGLGAALALGVGWVLQQRTAAHAAVSQLLSFRLLLHLMHKRVWWFGIAAMVVGQALGGWALDLGSIGLVEPLLSVNLLVAVVVAALLTRHRPAPHEIVGALLLSAALSVFIAVGDPRPADAPPAGPGPLAAGVGSTAAVVLILVLVGRRRSLIAESIVIASAAGVLYGLQDVATRGALVEWNDGGLRAVLGSPWAYLVVAAAVFGLLMSQSAFRAARLDCSLPPTAASEPVVGIALGTAMLGDRLSVSVGALVVESLCVVAMVGGVVIIARSPALRLHELSVIKHR